MRRNCSHCDIEQLVSDEDLGAGWVFVKCHICGETSTFSGNAWREFEKVSLTPSAKPVATEKTQGFVIPNLPEETITHQITSEIAQLITQAPAKLLRANPKPSNSRPPVAPEIVAKGNGVLRSNLLPISLALICVGSGFYILDSINRIKEVSTVMVTSENTPSQTPSSQTLSQAPSQSSADKAADQTGVTVASSASGEVKQAQVNRSPAIVDRIDLPTQAAPVPPEKNLEKGQNDAQTIVTVRARAALLRSGPGQGYPAQGNAYVSEKLILKGSKIVENQNWLQVQTPKGVLWIRADLVNGNGGSTQ